MWMLPSRFSGPRAYPISHRASSGFLESPRASWAIRVTSCSGSWSYTMETGTISASGEAVCSTASLT